MEPPIIFKSDDLINEGQGLRFNLPSLGEFTTGFVIRFAGKPYAYVNQCAHIPVELDWQQGNFLTAEKNFLICATHGAQYEPDTGYCVSGPCKGKRLKALVVTEEDHLISIQCD